MYTFDTEIVVSLAGIAIGVATAFLGIANGKKEAASNRKKIDSLIMEINKMKKDKISLNFEEIFIASKEISNNFKQIDFYPDIIYTFGAKSGLLAELISQCFDNHPLCITGCMQSASNKKQNIYLANSEIIENKKWELIIPEIIIVNVGKKILIVDDIAIGGDGIAMLLEKLLSKGFNEKDIKTATYICTSFAKNRKRAPDFFWKEVNGCEAYLPWGKLK